MTRILACCFLAILSFSCEKGYEDVEFRKVQNVEIKSIGNKNMELVGEVVLYNPNPFSLDLTEANLEVFINDRKSATIDQDLDATMPATAEFVMKLKANVPHGDVIGEKGENLLNTVLQVLSNQKVNVRYDGKINVGKGKIKFSVPVIDSLAVPVKLKF